MLPDVEISGRLFSPTIRVPPTPSSAIVTISLRDVTAHREIEARRLDFYSIIAHDLRSPLNAIALRTHLVSNGKHGALSPGLAADVHKIEENVQSLVVMINDFLEMARVVDSPLKIEQGEVDLVDLLDLTMETLHPLLDGAGLRWERHAAASPTEGRVMGDAKRLRQVLSNLLGNAIKFTPSPGVITTSIRCVGAWIEVVVADTGPGVPPHSLPTLFDRYTRGPDHRADVTGTGLGLMIVRQIVDAHGGSVGVESEVGVGSRFWVRLPANGAS
jgi:two-component system phosphate regulon sensor histidine kinase PhoR